MLKYTKPISNSLKNQNDYSIVPLAAVGAAIAAAAPGLASAAVGGAAVGASAVAAKKLVGDLNIDCNNIPALKSIYIIDN